jgi:LDH2 family malate/lactate/ureidoglycolate dehydrogenase
MEPADVTLSATSAQEFLTNILFGLGTPSDEAEIVAATLVRAESRGVRTHGLFRLPRYVGKLREGAIVSPSRMRVVRETASTLVVDGGMSWGQVVGVRTMRRCIEKARDAGSCIASVRDTNHFGAAAYYSELAAEAGMIGITMAASGGAGDGICVAPWGGYQALYDTNPIAIAVPGGRHDGPSLDMATTNVSQGRLRVYAQAGQPIPEGWALDKDGNPTTDPSAGLAGTMLPLGGYKGYGLGLMIDMLCLLLPGSVYPRTPNDGALFAALDVEAFRPLSEFTQGVDDLIDVIKGSPRRPGFDTILLPGERSKNAQSKAEAEGITVVGKTWASVLDIAREAGVAPPPVA